MNLSLHEIYLWLTEVDLPSLLAVWTWLITVPWWLAIGTTVFTIFAVRITWSLASYYYKMLSNWMFEAGGRFGEWMQVVRRYTSMTFEIYKSLKKILFRKSSRKR